MRCGLRLCGSHACAQLLQLTVDLCRDAVAETGEERLRGLVGVVAAAREEQCAEGEAERGAA